MFLTRQSGLRGSLIVLFVGLCVAFTMVIGLYLAGFDAVAALRDRNLSDAPEAGLISDLGILVMAFAGVTAAIEAWRSANLPLGILALFCWLFALDDALRIHEAFGPLESAIFALYGLLAALALFLFRKPGAPLTWPIIVAIAAFAFSVSIDVLWVWLVENLQTPVQTKHLLHRIGIVLEDVPKFGGILVLSSFAIGEAFLVRGIRKSMRLRSQ
ncbi:hypothetical protein [Tropicimonas aquimaris]|uniref:Uncharacterized protein n=1 Tax=Tropicimonas aquimaris TaxID=914152 RepID=A0ABW3IZ06_9RHOB